MTNIKYTKENWREVFRQKYGMKMKEMNLNEYLLLSKIADDIEKIVDNVAETTTEDILRYIYNYELEHSHIDNSFWGGIASKIFVDYKNMIYEIIKEKFIDKKYDK